MNWTGGRPIGGGGTNKTTTTAKSGRRDGRTECAAADDPIRGRLGAIASPSNSLPFLEHRRRWVHNSATYIRAQQKNKQTMIIEYGSVWKSSGGTLGKWQFYDEHKPMTNSETKWGGGAKTSGHGNFPFPFGYWRSEKFGKKTPRK